MTESVGGTTAVGQWHTLTQKQRNAFDLVILARRAAGAGERLRQQGDLRRIDGSGADAASRLVAVFQAELVAHHDAVGRLRLQRLAVRDQDKTGPRQADRTADTYADGQRRQQFGPYPRLERECALGLAAVLSNREIDRAPHRLGTGAGLDHLGEGVRRAKHLDGSFGNRLLRLDGDARRRAGQAVNDVGPLLRLLIGLAARFRADVGRQLHPCLLPLHDRPRLEVYVRRLMRPAVLEPGAIVEVPRTGRHARGERRSRFVPRFKDQLVPFAVAVPGFEAHLALEMLGERSPDVEAQQAFLARRPNLMGADALDGERTRDGTLGEELPGEQRLRRLRPQQERQHGSQCQRRQKQDRPFPTPGVGDAREVEGGGLLLGLPRDGGDHRRRHALRVGPRPVELHRRDEPMTQLGHLLLDPQCHLRVTQPPGQQPQEEHHSGQPQRNLHAEQRPAQPARRIAVQIDDEIDQAGGGEDGGEDGQAARRGPGQPQQTLAPAQAVQLSLDGTGHHKHQLRFENLRSSHSALIRPTNSNRANGPHSKISCRCTNGSVRASMSEAK